MDWSIQQPWWLLLAALAVPLGLVAWRAFVSMSPARRWSAIVARTLLLVLLGLMLAGVANVRETERLAIVAVIDVSGSIDRFAPPETHERVRTWLATASRNRGPNDLLGAVVFDGRSLAIASPTNADISDRAFNVRLSEGTDIAGALRAASALIPQDAAGRIVLITDGAQTQGDAVGVARELASIPGAVRPIDVVPIRYTARAETMIERLDAPPTANAQATVPVRVLLRSTAGSAGTLRLSLAGQPIDLDPASPGTGRTLTLDPGRNVVTTEVTLPPGRIHAFEAVFEPDRDADGDVLLGDTALDNNRAEAFTISPGAGLVLLITQESVAGDEASGSARLAGVLRGAGLGLETTVGAGVPQDLLALQEYDCVILDNVPAEDLSPRTHEALAAYVQSTGGGLIMAGGPDSFGAGGWLGTDLEPVLPVLLDLPDQLVVPEAAVVFVLDSSGSMNASVMGSARTQQQIANQSAALAITALDARDEVAVIAFNSTTNVVRPLSPNSDPKAAAEAINAIASGGGTNLGPALLEAGRQLESSEARIKHVIVLSDGRSQNAGVLPAMAEDLNRRGIKLTAITIGDQSDAITMQQMAQAGEGAYYNVFNPNLLPRVFLKAVRVVRSPLVREGRFTPVVADPAASLQYGVDIPPALAGLVLTQARAEANVVNVLLAPEGEPILSTWQTELGRVAAFTADTGRWSRPWIDDGVYAPFWTALVRSIARPDTDRGGELIVTPTDDALRITLDAFDADGRPRDRLTVPATVYAPSGRTEEIVLIQTGPGRYQASVPVSGSGNHIVVTRPRLGTRPLPPIIGGVATRLGAEFRRLTSDDTLLEQLAFETGGRVLDLNAPPLARDAGGLWDRAGVTPARARTPLWPVLLVASLTLLLMDIGTRRVAWDRLLEDSAEGRVTRMPQSSASTSELASTTRSLRSRVRSENALGDFEAAEIVREQHRRRQHGRISTERASPSTPTSVPQSVPANETRAPPQPDAPASKATIERRHGQADESRTDAEPGGLLAAKRRARERFERE